MLLTRDQLLQRFEQNVRRASKIDIAVAWATPCRALSAVCTAAKNGALLRCIVGIASNGTHPNALRDLREVGQLKISFAERGIFHPKFYLFHVAGERIAWIGSSNLTVRGFDLNEELIVEISDHGGEALAWFESVWNNTSKSSSDIIDDYITKWKPPPFDGNLRLNGALYSRPSKPNIFEGMNWDQYVSELFKADIYWKKIPEIGSVFGENSWLTTIERGHSVAIRDNWDQLTHEDRRLLLGRGGYYGLLGSMTGAGKANGIFNQTGKDVLQLRRSIRNALQRVIEADGEAFSAAACDFIDEVSGI